MESYHVIRREILKLKKQVDTGTCNPAMASRNCHELLSRELLHSITEKEYYDLTEFVNRLFGIHIDTDIIQELLGRPEKEPRLDTA